MVPDFATKLIDKIIAQEGGWVYTDDPVDTGKGTFAGVTYAIFRNYWLEKYDKNLSPEEFKKLVINETTPKRKAVSEAIYRIYYENYFDKIPHDILREELWEMVFSCAVNCGINRAMRILQATVNEQHVMPLLEIDGIFGSKSRFALQRVMTTEFHLAPGTKNRFCKEFVNIWMHWYFTIIRNQSNQVKFIEGWYNRAIQYR